MKVADESSLVWRGNSKQEIYSWNNIHRHRLISVHISNNASSLFVHRWYAPTCSCRWPLWWEYRMMRVLSWLNWLAPSSFSMSLLLMRNYLNWRATDSTDLMKSSMTKDNGYLWVFICVESGYFEIIHPAWFCSSCFRSDQKQSPLMLCAALPTSAQWALWLEAYVSIPTLFHRTTLNWILTPCVSSSLKASICPTRRTEVSSLVFRAMLTGTCVSIVNACVAGKSFRTENAAFALLLHLIYDHRCNF